MLRICTAIVLGFAFLIADGAPGHLPYPFGYELTGYQVQDLRATLDKAKTAGVKISSAIYTTGDGTSTIVEFPGSYIAEIHSLAVH